MTRSVRSCAFLLVLASGLGLHTGLHTGLHMGARTAHSQHSPLSDVLNGEQLAAELPPREPPSDARFFGTYCLAAPKQYCKSIPLLPDPCVTISAVKVHLNHVRMPTGAIVTGDGEVTKDGHAGELALSGSVLEKGRLKIAAVIPGLGRQRGELTLSDDGLELRGTTQNRSIALRKDACGNHAPSVVLSAVGGPSFTFGQSVMLSGTITDEDTDIPAERIVFSSSLQGVLAGWRPTPRTLVPSVLVPGTHTITLRVTDSGGLSGEAQMQITVSNRPPLAPLIYLPAQAATAVAGGSMLLKGAAVDPDSGVLPGAALSWSAQLTQGGPFSPLGTGHELPTVFANAGEVVIRLTATDSGGQQSSAERLLRVAPNGGNTPPVVVIRQPDRNELSGPVAAGAFAGTPMPLVATVFDAESVPTDLQLTWTFALLGANGQADPSPAQPNPAPITGTVAPTVTFPAVGARNYRVTFTATDPGGLSSSDSVDILVTSSIIL